MKHKFIGVLFGLMGCAALAGCGNAGAGAAGNAVDTAAPTATEAVAESPEDKVASPSGGATEADTTQPDSDEPDYEAVYAPVFAEVLEVIENGYDYEKEYRYVSDGLVEKIMYPGDGDLMDAVGYVLMDVSGDGVPELLIGCDEVYDTAHPESYFFEVYTVKDDEPFPVFEGWARSNYIWMGDGHFYYLGSNGAMSTLMGENHLCKDGTEIVWDDFYFTEEKADGEIGYYHNTTGIYDTEKSEELSAFEDRFIELMDDYEARCQQLSWIPIGSLKGKYETTATAGSPPSSGDSRSASLEKELTDEWLFLNGAILSIENDGTFGLYDDSYNWILSGTWEAEPGTDAVTVTLFSEAGDAGNRQIAEGSLQEDSTGYLVLDLKFVPGLTTFTDGEATLSQKPKNP